MKKNHNTNNLEKGVTLIELLIYMVIFSLLLTIIMQMFGSLFDAQKESEATSSVAQDGRYIINRLSYDLIRSQNIVSTGSSTLSFVIDGATDSYSLSNGNLNFTNGLTGTTDALNSQASSVSAVTFTKIGNNNGKSTVQVIFTLNSIATKRSGKETKTFETTIGTR